MRTLFVFFCSKLTYQFNLNAARQFCHVILVNFLPGILYLAAFPESLSRGTLNR